MSKWSYSSKRIWYIAFKDKVPKEGHGGTVVGTNLPAVGMGALQAVDIGRSGGSNVRRDAILISVPDSVPEVFRFIPMHLNQ